MINQFNPEPRQFPSPKAMLVLVTQFAIKLRFIAAECLHRTVAQLDDQASIGFHLGDYVQYFCVYGFTVQWICYFDDGAAWRRVMQRIVFTYCIALKPGTRAFF